MIYRRTPKDFSPRFEIVQCYLEHEGKLLMLKRLPEKSQGDKWGVPGGKVDANESLQQAIIRELREETGIDIEESQLSFLGSLYVRYPDYDFKSHMFFTATDSLPTVKICQHEHSDYSWVTIDEACQLNLVLDQDKSFQIFSTLLGKYEPIPTY